MQSQLVRTGDPNLDNHQAAHLAAQLRSQGMTVKLVPDPMGGVWVQAWSPALPKPPSAFRRLLKSAGDDLRTFNFVAAVTAALVTLPLLLIWHLQRLEMELGMMVAAPVALVVMVVLSVLTATRWWRAVSGTLVGTALATYLMTMTPGPAFATVHVDNPGDEPLHVFADAERIATVEAGDHETLNVKVDTRKIGWGASKKKPQHRSKARLVESSSHLLTPEPGRCYMLVGAQYSPAGLGDGDDSLAILPDARFQPLSPAPHFLFQDLPESITVKLSDSQSMRYALRRSLACDELASCTKRVRDDLSACYGRSQSQEDAIACETAARRSCGKPGTKPFRRSSH
ncbi:MAG: hypothetical protein R3B72_12195 [Polyangiaceae bacterium]